MKLQNLTAIILMPFLLSVFFDESHDGRYLQKSGPVSLGAEHQIGVFVHPGLKKGQSLSHKLYQHPVVHACDLWAVEREIGDLGLIPKTHIEIDTQKRSDEFIVAFIYRGREVPVTSPLKVDQEKFQLLETIDDLTVEGVRMDGPHLRDLCLQIEQQREGLGLCVTQEHDVGRDKCEPSAQENSQDNWDDDRVDQVDLFNFKARHSVSLSPYVRGHNAEKHHLFSGATFKGGRA